MQRCRQELTDGGYQLKDRFERAVELLKQPSEENKQKFLVAYEGFAARHGNRYFYTRALLYELGRIYWEFDM